MAFSFDGHLLDTKNLIRHEPQPFPLKTLTYLCNNHNSMKIMITEHAMNTALKTFHQQKILSLTEIPRLPQMVINALVPSFKMAYGRDVKVKIVFDTNDI
jgi:hypothetical protein